MAGQTLHEVLQIDSAKAIPEGDWAGLVRSIATGDQLALHALYERTYRAVFTLATRITGNRESAEDAAVDLFCDVWRRSPGYDPETGTVLGWIMNQARSRAIERTPEARLPPTGRPTDISPPASLQPRIARRIAEDADERPILPVLRQWQEPQWEQVSEGLFYQLLATDIERSRVSMLVRLAAGVEYPPHVHAGVEQLHLLDGELWINERKLVPGDYNRAEPGTADRRVWSETGCACVLITSSADILL